jgi:formylglycine-generating enzyme
MIVHRRALLVSALATGVMARPVFAADAFRGDRFGQAKSLANLELIWAPAGRFRMGTPRTEPERRPGEDQVDVTLTKGFWIGKFAVTQAQWRSVMGSMPGELSAGAGDDYPIYNMNHFEAEDFCIRLTARERATARLPVGWAFRLPTEAQWEYAGRAGTTTATSFGDRLSSYQANFRGNKPYNGAPLGPALGRTAPVGSYPPNPWGLYEVHGNVFEWCRDWFHDRLLGGADPDLHDAAATAAPNRTQSLSRSRRGGCWADEGWPCRSGFRLRFEPERRADHIGLRVVAVEL